MLRTVKSNRVGLKLLRVRYTTATGAVVVNSPASDMTTPTDNGTGDTTFTLKNPFARVPVVIATPMAGVDASGAMVQIVSALAGAARVKTATNAGSATDGGCHALIAGWTSADTNISVMKQQARSFGYNCRIIPMYFSAAGTIVEGKTQATASAVTEVTTILFKNAFRTTPSVFAISAVAGTTMNVVSTAVDKVVVNQHDSSGSATTGAFHLIVVGMEGANRQHVIKAPQIRPRLLIGRIAVSGGTPAVTGYEDLGTVTDNGVGDYTLTFQKPFLRAPVVLGSMSSLGSVAATTRSVTATRLVCQTHAGVAVDPTAVHVLVCGFDYADQV